MSAKRPVTFEDVETNVLFMMSLSMDLILRDIDRKIRVEALSRGKVGGFKNQYNKRRKKNAND